jgi:hypothetical protein
LQHHNGGVKFIALRLQEWILREINNILHPSRNIQRVTSGDERHSEIARRG